MFPPQPLQDYTGNSTETSPAGEYQFLRMQLLVVMSGSFSVNSDIIWKSSNIKGYLLLLNDEEEIPQVLHRVHHTWM